MRQRNIFWAKILLAKDCHTDSNRYHTPLYIYFLKLFSNLVAVTLNFVDYLFGCQENTEINYWFSFKELPSFEQISNDVRKYGNFSSCRFSQTLTAVVPLTCYLSFCSIVIFRFRFFPIYYLCLNQFCQTTTFINNISDHLLDRCLTLQLHANSNADELFRH